MRRLGSNPGHTIINSLTVLQKECLCVIASMGHWKFCISLCLCLGQYTNFVTNEKVCKPHVYQSFQNSFTIITIIATAKTAITMLSGISGHFTTRSGLSNLIIPAQVPGGLNFIINLGNFFLWMWSQWQIYFSLWDLGFSRRWGSCPPPSIPFL